MSTCSVSDCSSPPCGRGYCNKHWLRWRRHGDPTAGRTPDGAPLAHFHQQILVESDECFIWPYGTSGDGYGCFTVDGTARKTHRYACELTHGPCPEGMEAAHFCGVRACFNPRHLRWATKRENQLDRVLHGTHGRGSRSGTAKLTEGQVLLIRAMRGRVPAKALSDHFGVSVGSIRDIWNRHRWGWL